MRHLAAILLTFLGIWGGVALAAEGSTAGPKRGAGSVMVMEREIIRGERQAPRAFYVLERTPVRFAAPPLGHDALREIERSTLGDAF